MVAVALWLLSGCGGGGGGGGTGGGTSNIAAGQYFEFFDGGGNWIDPFDLSAGQTGTAVLVNYDSLGNRTVLPPTGSGYQTTAPGGAGPRNGSRATAAASAGRRRWTSPSISWAGVAWGQTRRV